MADYSRPKPIDPIWYQPAARLNIRCTCGRNETYSLREFARFHRLSENMLLHELVDRLRCSHCKARPHATVTKGRGGQVMCPQCRCPR